LDQLVFRESVDTRLDYLLGAIGKAHSKPLIDFLGARVRRKRDLETDGDMLSRYEAIPFRFHKLNEVLTKDGDYMLQQMQAWYREDPKLF
jgi:hypothetical protein